MRPVSLELVVVFLCSLIWYIRLHWAVIRTLLAPAGVLLAITAFVLVLQRLIPAAKLSAVVVDGRERVSTAEGSELTPDHAATMEATPEKRRRAELDLQRAKALSLLDCCPCP